MEPLAVASPLHHAAPAAARSAPVGTPAAPLPLVIDSDPGLDDALAIGLAAASPELDLLAVTTVGGNADVGHCTENALRLLHLFGRPEIPVAEGAPGALLGSVVRATQIHGSGGIGSTVLEPAAATARPGGAVELLVRILEDHPAPVVIAPVGPLTNIALLLRVRPDLAPRISHLCLMGGAIGEGNATASAEFNIYADPEAAEIVFTAGIPITMMGLDVTLRATLDRTAADALGAAGTRSGRVASELAHFAIDRIEEWTGSPTYGVHDAVAVAHLVVPDLVRVARYHVAIDATHGPARGRTVADGLARRLERDGRRPNADVGISIDRDRFERLLVGAFARLP